MAGTAKIGDNREKTLVGVSSIDGSTLVNIFANPTTQALHVQLVDSSGNNIYTNITPLSVGIAAALNGDNTIIAAVTLKKIYVYAWNISFSGTVNAKFTDGASGALLNGIMYGVSSAGGGSSVNPPNYLWVGSTATALILNLSGATPVGGSVSYFVL
jgi:hypothetical protein